MPPSNRGPQSAEGVKIEASWVCGGMSSLQPTRRSGRTSWAPPLEAENAFWRILKATERSFSTYMPMLWVWRTV